MDVINEVIHIALCDDETYVHEDIINMVNTYNSIKNYNLELLHFYSAKEMLSYKGIFEILLLEIDLPDMDGIEAGRRILKNNRYCKIIMLTCKAERFKDAFKIRAYRFVTKPIDTGEFYEALDDAVAVLPGKNTVQVKLHGMWYCIYICDIDYIQACGDYVKIYTGDRIYESDRTLKYWSNWLDRYFFTECHKSYIVNMEKIKSIGKEKIILKSGAGIPVSRRKRKDVLQKFMEYDINSH